MNDQAKYTVTLEFETDGANAEINNLRKLQEAVDGVSRRNGLSEKSQLSLSRALDRTGKAAGATADQQKTATQQQIIASQQTALYNQYLYDQEKALKKSEGSIISLRYANYDLANTLFAVSAAITAVGAASLVAFAQQESAFTEVERIAGGSLLEIQNLRDELQAMSTDIPVAFGELSNIASLGAALDIPAAELDEFTEAVAKFAATTGVTVEAAATGFGKLAAYLEIPEEQFENLGSAILRAGNISVATEEQVLKFAQALALPGARIGFTTDQVVALGATLASFGNINVEGAGSALNRVTKNIERALAENGEALQTWAATAGMSSEAFRVAWGSDVSGTFNRVIQGLSGNIEGLVGSLDALGIRNVRDQRIIEALALNYDKYNQILGETTSAWREGTYMNEAYGLVLDDLASKFQIMLNAFSNFAAAVGAELAPAFGTLVDLVTQALVGLTDFINSPIGGTITRTVALLAGLAAGYAALRGVIALATASTLAFQFISQSLAGRGIIAALGGLSKAFLGVSSAGRHAAASTLTLAGAIKTLLRATIIGGVLAYVAEWILAPGEAAQWTADMLLGLLRTIEYLREKLGSVGSTLLGFGGSQGGGAIKDLSDFFGDVAKNFPSANSSVNDFDKSIQELFNSLEDGEDAAGGAAGGIGDVGNAAAAAAQQIRTLVDYAGDLSGVWQRAFDIRFGGAQGLDTIRSTFISIRDAADEAAKRIRDLKNDISGLSSDISIQEYFLSIAVEYGDTQRAAAIEADLAKKRADLADKTAELQKQQDAASMSLVGTSKGAIENRQQILELVSQYQSYLQALAASGLSQGALAAKSEQLRQEFLAQAMDLGYSREELRLYEAAFIDTARIISAVPFGVTTDLSSLDPALLAIREFVDQANADLNTLGSGIGGAMGGGIGAGNAALRTGLDQTKKDVMTPSDLVGKEIGNNISKGVKSKVDDKNSGISPSIQGALVFSTGNSTASYNLGRSISTGILGGMSGLLDLHFGAGTTNRKAIRSVLGFADGGYTGAGGKYDPAGIVHRGEYVIPKQDVNQRTGLPYADALGRLMNGIPGMASGGPTTGSGSGSSLATVALTPGTIQAIAQATGKVIVLDGRVIADSSANSYSQDNVVGRY